MTTVATGVALGPDDNPVHNESMASLMVFAVAAVHVTFEDGHVSVLRPAYVGDMLDRRLSGLERVVRMELVPFEDVVLDCPLVFEDDLNAGLDAFYYGMHRVAWSPRVCFGHAHECSHMLYLLRVGEDEERDEDDEDGDMWTDSVSFEEMLQFMHMVRHYQQAGRLPRTHVSLVSVGNCCDGRRSSAGASARR